MALGTGVASAQTVSVPAAPTPAPEVGPLRVLQLGGSAEVLNRAWEQAQVSQNVVQALRTGTGRAVLGLPEGGKLMLGSASMLRLNNGQPDLQNGRFFVNGVGQLYLAGVHLNTQGQVRMDADGKVLRVAVVMGQVRVSREGRTTMLSAGQQYDLLSDQVHPFNEKDPWYRSQFAGSGDVTVQATRGSVMAAPSDQSASSWQMVQLGQKLNTGGRIRTGSNAWAELGFTGGGYLRLQADSQLKVLSVDRTASGRQVLLQLESGSAWNVVAKGQGGYQITTPTVTTAVRGTVFRVDAAGLVKVFDGVVALPAQADVLLSVGQQRSLTGRVEPIQRDALDDLNMTLDTERSARTVLNISSLNLTPDLQLAVNSNPNAVLTATIGNDTYPLAGEGSAYQLKQALPEGRYTLTLRALRPGQIGVLSRTLTVDRTPPVRAYHEPATHRARSQDSRRRERRPDSQTAAAGHTGRQDLYPARQRPLRVDAARCFRPAGPSDHGT
ncbi:FecR family protein [Deinococcus sp. KNUC1210]|uniref:FecR family protein n=1 Tax=Deinococcus sp. KNUC1210 TaxID=2917691 RepID=UPI001EF0C5DC|nr:FecR family protein [Deinococcus sp. KNUC1210]ULH15194.1 FecR family protein [Deinococcus sp. KNUC1210]